MSYFVLGHESVTKKGMQYAIGEKKYVQFVPYLPIRT
jgi:hypothetical protein